MTQHRVRDKAMNHLTYLTSFASIAALIFAAWKYLDTKKAEEKNKRFEQFRLISIWVSGYTEAGQHLNSVHQAIAVYQLTEFPEYASISLKIIDYFIELGGREPSTPPFLLSALTDARKHLEKSN
jgi:hypothetical protein